MAYQDARQFALALEEQGELVRINQKVDLYLEVGAICRKALDTKAPALWFQQPGPSRVPLVTNLLATRERVAQALGTTVDQLHEEWLQRTSRPPTETTVKVKVGPCKERILVGEDVDLNDIPVPFWNKGDGGRFITLACCISRDPNTGKVNMGIYRNQLHRRNRVGLFAHPFRHVMLQAREILQAGQRFPVALVIGVDPLIAMAATANLAFGSEELALAAALRQAPVEMVPCETISLEVPAYAEYVLEGEILPDVKIEEGPFGEVTGYYGEVAPRPVVEIKAITHRKDPIHVAAYTGRPPSENAMMVAVQIEAELMRTVTLPGIQRVHVTEGGCGSFNCVVSIRKTFEGMGKMMGMAIFGTWAGRPIKNLIIVDDDIDPLDWNQVEWALASRFQPNRDLQIVEDVIGHALDPSLPELEKQRKSGLTSKMILDATKYNAASYEKECLPDPETARLVEERWAQYGILACR